MRRKRVCKNNKRRREVYIKKILIGFFALMIAAGFSLTLGSNFAEAETNSAASSVQKKYYKSIVIEEGDSLWQIADEYKDDHYDSIYAYIDEVVSINDLDSDEIHEGQYLTVPYYDYL